MFNGLGFWGGGSGPSRIEQLVTKVPCKNVTTLDQMVTKCKVSGVVGGEINRDSGTARVDGGK